MTTRHLVAALSVLALTACPGTSGSTTQTAAVSSAGYTLATWTADATNVDCVGADRMVHATLAADVNGDGVVAPGETEDEIVCTWWCASYGGREPIALGVDFGIRNGVWTPVLIAPGPQQCAAR